MSNPSPHQATHFLRKSNLKTHLMRNQPLFMEFKGNLKRKYWLLEFSRGNQCLRVLFNKIFTNFATSIVD